MNEKAGGSGTGSGSSSGQGQLSIRELTRKITDLETAVSAERDQKKVLQDEANQLKFQLTVLRDQILDTEEVIRRSNQLEKEKSKELSLLKRDHEAVKYRCEVLEQQVEYRDEKLKELGVFVNLSGHFESTHSNSHSETPNGDQIMTSSNDLDASRASNTSPLSSPMSKMDEKVSKLQAEINSLKLDLQIEKTKNQNLDLVNHSGDDKSQSGGASSDSGKLQTKMRELEFKNLQLEKDKEFLQNSLILAEKARDRETAKVEEFEEQENKLKAEVKTLKKDLKKLQHDFDDLQSTKNSLMRKIEKQEKSRKGVNL